ncbi:MAG: long-chain fatty acid--CoA ligase [Acidimicrobiia bacterium]|nr:long-chain fatty acid--CoA ligase [Acidimicrobiia bacterium]
MPELIALPSVGSDEFVGWLQRCWERGAAALPVDPRLPPTAAERLLEALRPTSVLDHLGPLAQPRPWLDSAGRPGVEVEDGDALVVATSGSTGTPKGAILTHDAVAAAAVATSGRLRVDPTHDRWLACLPLSHVGGLSVVTRALHTGCALVVHERPDPDQISEAARLGATRTSLVATLLPRCDLTGFRTVLVGGGPAPSAAPPNVVATYGLTESGGGVVYDGRPLDGVEVRVVDGEVRLRGPMLLRAYRHGPARFDDDGWLCTGDAGHLRPDGTLEVVGRVGDMIVTGGEKVWPAPVEQILAEHPGVASVLVVGRPDDHWGQAVTALVQPVDPADPPRLAAIRDWARGRLAPWQVPQRLEVVRELPRTALGKVRRQPRSADDLAAELSDADDNPGDEGG